MAIAFVGSAEIGYNGDVSNSLTGAYTVGGGSDRLLVVGLLGGRVGSEAFDDITGVTFSGQAMTLGVKNISVTASSGRYCYIYYILNPPSVTANVVINCTNIHVLIAVAADYTGIAQSGQPDASTTNEAAGFGTSLTTAHTTIADGSWPILLHSGYDGNSAPTAGAGATLRITDATFGAAALFDSNGPVTPAGSYSMTSTYPSAPTTLITEHAILSFAPSTPPPPQLVLMSQICL